MDCKNQRNQMVDGRIDHILSYFSHFHMFKKASKFCGHEYRLGLRLWALHTKCLGPLVAVNSVGGLDTRPSEYWQIEP